MTRTTKGLTRKQQEWLGHIESCRRSGQSVQEYARKQRLSAPQLYTWTSRLRDLGVLDRTPGRSGAPGSVAAGGRPHFSPVRVVSEVDRPAVGLRIRFPNGVVLELEGSRAPDPALLSTLASLP